MTAGYTGNPDTYKLYSLYAGNTGHFHMVPKYPKTGYNLDNHCESLELIKEPFKNISFSITSFCSAVCYPITIFHPHNSNG